MKTYLADEDGYNGPLSLFTAAMVAVIVSLDNWEHYLIWHYCPVEVPAAGLPTPADVYSEYELGDFEHYGLWKCL